MRTLLVVVLLQCAVPAFLQYMGYDCNRRCGSSWSPVCTQFDRTYPNECVAQCRGEYVVCDNVCPCRGKPSYPYPQPYPYPYPAPYPYPGPVYPVGDPPSYDTPSYTCNCGNKYDPVCSVSGEEYDNQCLAQCEGQYIQCEGKCPCT